MTVSQLYAALEKTFPKEYACEWDNDGLMCAADLNAEVRKVLCTLDVTKEALEYAAANGFDTILSHHPMIFRPLCALTPENHIAEKAIFAMQKRINVFSYHTRFDTMPGGMNDLLANAFGLTDVRAFSDGESETGRVGVLTSEMSLEDFCFLVKDTLKCDVLSVSAYKSTVKTVAVLGGAGKDFIRGAIRAGADVLVTGELSYNTMAEAAEMGITLIEAGHFFTENIICEYFAEKLANLGIENACFCSNRIRVL